MFYSLQCCVYRHCCPKINVTFQINLVNSRDDCLRLFQFSQQFTSFFSYQLILIILVLKFSGIFEWMLISCRNNLDHHRFLFHTNHLRTEWEKANNWNGKICWFSWSSLNGISLFYPMIFVHWTVDSLSFL